jgi:hypothetical protein
MLKQKVIMKLLHAGFFESMNDYENLNDGFTRKSCPPPGSAYHVSEVAQPQKQTKLHHLQPNEIIEIQRLFSEEG